MNSEYWEGYAGQFCLFVDEFAQVKNIDKRAQTSSDLINARNSLPFHLNMASLDSKANTYFTSRMICVSTNAEKFENLGIESVGALSRRQDLLIYMGKRFASDNPLVDRDAWNMHLVGCSSVDAHEQMPYGAEYPLVTYAEVLELAQEFIMQKASDYYAAQETAKVQYDGGLSDVQVENYKKQLKKKDWAQLKKTPYERAKDILGYRADVIRCGLKWARPKPLEIPEELRTLVDSNIYDGQGDLPQSRIDSIAALKADLSKPDPSSSTIIDRYMKYFELINRIGAYDPTMEAFRHVRGKFAMNTTLPHTLHCDLPNIRTNCASHITPQFERIYACRNIPWSKSTLS